MAVNLSPFGGVGAQFFDGSGDPLSGGKIYTYTAGTTTPAVTYTSSLGNIPHPNPIILDSAGRVPSGGEIWLTDGLQYKFLLKDANDVQIASYDNVIGINSNFVAFTNSQEIQTATAGQTVFTLTTMQYQPGTNSLSVFVDGVNQYGPGAQYAYVETNGTTVTFTNGLHVGAEVKFTNSQLNTSGAVDASQVSYDPPFTGGVATNVESKLAQTVSVKDFGAVGDGVTDDTAAFNAAIAYCNANQKTLYIPAGVTGNYKITSALTTFSSTGGIEMEAVGYDYTSKGCILVDGTGYTAVTIVGTLARCNLAVVGTGNAANGILFQNPIACRINKIRVMQLDGFGIKINKCWDCTFEHIMVELCGNSSEYAFSMNDDGDTCNMSHIMCMQVEQANTKAIFISPNTLSCVIDNIHSERASVNSPTETWVLGGNRCQYNALRLEANAPTANNATAKFTGSQTQYNAPLVEGAASIKLEGGNGNTITIISPEFQGTTSSILNQTGTINIFGGSIVALNCDPNGFKVYGTKIELLNVGFANYDPNLGIWENCSITELDSSSTLSAATFVNCVIGTHNSLLEGVTVLRGCTINNDASATLTVGYRTLYTYNSTINAPVAIDNGYVFSYGTTFGSTLAQTGGSISSIFDDSSYAVGAVSGLGAPAAGAWAKGARTKNMNPTVGQPKAWICTVAGSPGTWTSEGNL